MLVLGTYLVGLAVAHLAWFYFFTTGLLLRPVSNDARSFSIADLVITSVTGMALSGFSLLILGFSHLLNGLGLSIVVVSEGVLFWFLKGGNWLSLIFWRQTWQQFIGAWTLPAFFIYVVFLLLGFPAVAPPTLADSVAYHLPYAVDWANAGRIYVDPFLRFPYYANNFLLFDSAFFILRLGDYCNFLSWLCGLLTCLGILAFLSPANTDVASGSSKAGFQPQQFLIPLTVALCPIFLRYLNNSYLDVPIGLFIVVVVLCVYSTSSQCSFERELVLIGGFCAGMKLTLIGHVPFFLVSLFVVCHGRLQSRKIALLAILLVALSLPWYARNLIETGDPTPPVFNLHFNRSDPVFIKADANIYTADTVTEQKPAHLLLLPFKFFIDPTSKNFREPYANALILLLYAPVVFLSARLFLSQRWRWPPRLTYLSAAVVYLAVPWFFSSLGRYSLHWFPVLAAWVGVIVSYICASADQRWSSPVGLRTTRIVAAVFCCVLIIPTSLRGSVQFYRNQYTPAIDLWRLRGNRERYLEVKLPGYLASKAVIEALASAGKTQAHVLVLGTERLHFYLRKNANIIAVGDYFGPARYRELFNELQRSENCPGYLNQLGIVAVIIPAVRSEPWWAKFYPHLQARLTRCGYKEYRSAEDNIAIFLRSDVKPSVGLEPVTE